MKYDYACYSNKGVEGFSVPGEVEAPRFKNTDVILGICMLVVGFLYWNLMGEGLSGFFDLLPTFASALGLGVTIFAVILCSVTLIYFKASGVRQTKRSLFWLGIVLLSALQFSLFAGGVEKFFNFFFLTCAFIYWTCVSTERQLDKKLSIYVIGDIVNQTILVPFSNFSCCFLGIRGGAAGHRNGKAIFSALAGIGIFLPVLIVVIHLLTAADIAFSNLIDGLLAAISFEAIMPYVGQFVLGIPVAFYMYGLLYGNVIGRNTEKMKKESVDGFAKKISIAPNMTIYAAMTTFLLVYALFFLVQASYLFSAFSSQLPEAMTYAQYARQGFFELCAVSGINLALMAVTHAFIKKGEESKLSIPKALRVQTVILCIFTMLLIATAVSKMVMYVESYGLTHLRVYTTWFMALLFFIFAVATVRQIKSFNATRILAVGFIVLFMGLCYGNVDSLIGKYNVERYEAGTLEFMDGEILARLSDGAAVHLYGLYQDTEDANVKAALYAKLTGYGEEYSQERGGDSEPKRTFRGFNAQSYMAEEIKTVLTVSP